MGFKVQTKNIKSQNMLIKDSNHVRQNVKKPNQYPLIEEFSLSYLLFLLLFAKLNIYYM